MAETGVEWSGVERRREMVVNPLDLESLRAKDREDTKLYDDDAMPPCRYATMPLCRLWTFSMGFALVFFNYLINITFATQVQTVI